MPNVVQTIQLLEEFSKLPKGWNFGTGEPSALLPLRQSKAVLAFAYSLGLDDIDAFPGTDGEIQLNIYKNEANIELMFEINGTIGITFEERDNYIRLAREASLSEVFKYMKEFQYNKCRTSVSLISRSTTFPEKSVLQAQRLSPPATEAAYRLLAKNVVRNTVVRYVPTLHNIMPAWQGHLSSSGKSRTNKSRQTVN